MPVLPWAQRHSADPDCQGVAMAKRRRSVPGFLRDTLAIRRQLARAVGLVGYALDADLARKTFWTFSVWEDRASLDAFAAADPHRAITGRLRPLMGQTASSSSRSRFGPAPDLGPDEITRAGSAESRPQPVRCCVLAAQGAPGRPGERRQQR